MNTITIEQIKTLGNIPKTLHDILYEWPMTSRSEPNVHQKK